MNSMGYRNGAYNFNFFGPGVTNPVAGSNGGSGRFPGSGLHIPLPGGADPTIMPWGYNAQAGGSYFTAHYDSLGNHPKAAIDYHLKTGHRETA
jgi:hypothetical protein